TRRTRSGSGSQPEHRARARRTDRGPEQTPLRRDRSGVRGADPGEPRHRDGGERPVSVQVLIADDEALIRQSLRTTLAREGFDVTVAASGNEAWLRFQEDRPDVVLLDLVLGDLDRMEVLRRIRQETPDTKVILISAHGSIESAVAARKIGGYDFIKKPFELEEIVAAVRNAARTRSLEQRVAYMTEQERKRTDAGAFVHAAPRMTEILREVQVIA